MLHIGHYRVDQITRTGVVEPWNIQQRNPVSVAEKILNFFTKPFTMPGPGLRQRVPNPVSRMSTVPGNTPAPVAGPQLAGSPFYGRNMPAVPSAGAGQVGTLVTRDPNGNMVMKVTRASGLAPHDPLLGPVQRSTVGIAPMHNIYGVLLGQRQAFATGSIWAQTRARQNVVRDYRGVKLPFTAGL